MDLKLFHRTQRDLATAINHTVDAYWKNELTEKELIDMIQSLYKHNMSKLVKGNGFTSIIQQQCGKRRLEVVRKILNLN